jgi:flagellar protein FliJ
MKKFNFRLEKILRYKEQLEEDKKMKLAAKQADLLIEQKKLLILIETRDRYFQKYGVRKKGKVNITQLILSKRYLDKLGRDISLQNDIVGKAEVSVSEAQQELIEAAKERKKYEKLKTRYKTNYNKEMVRLEGIELDEFGSRKIGFGKNTL